MRSRLLLSLLLSIAIAGCNRQRTDDAALADYTDRENAAAEAAMQQEMNAIAAIKANIAAQALANESLQVEDDAAAVNFVLPDVPSDVDDADTVPATAAPGPPAPPSAAEIDAADASVKAAMERQRAGR